MNDIYITYIWKTLFLLSSGVTGVLLTIIGWLWFRVETLTVDSSNSIKEIQNAVLELRASIEHLNVTMDIPEVREMEQSLIKIETSLNNSTSVCTERTKHLENALMELSKDISSLKTKYEDREVVKL